MPSRYIPSDLDQLRQPKDPKAQLVQSLEKIVREYPPRDSYNPRECHGLYSGPTSIAYLFLQIWRNHPKLIIAKTTPDYWAVQYLRGERTFSPITPAKNGIGSETLAFHVVRGAVNQKDPLDEQKFLNWMRPLADTDEGMFFELIICFPLSSRLYFTCHELRSENSPWDDVSQLAIFTLLVITDTRH